MNTSGSPNLSDLLVRSISDLLAGNTPEQRADAAVRLGQTRSRAAVSYLIKALADTAPEVRLAAVNSLGEIGDPASIDPLKRLLESETSELVSRAAILSAISKAEQPKPELSTRPQTATLNDLLGASYQKIESTLRAPSAALKPSDAESEIGRYADNVFRETVALGDASQKRQHLDEVYRHAAEQRELLEQTRRRAYEEARRHAEEVLRSLEADEESLAQFQQDLAARRVRVKEAKKAAAAEESRLRELEARLATEQASRRQLEEENLRLQTENRARVEAERNRRQRLEMETAEQQQRDSEHEASLERIGRLRTESEAYYREQSELLNNELTNLQKAGQELSRLRAGAEAARERAEEEIAGLPEADERIQGAEGARAAAA